MNKKANALAAALIRNFHTAPMERFQREPLYDAVGARLAKGTAARKLGASVDVVAPGKVTCPYHAHRAQEEMFVVIEGSGTLRVAGEMLPIKPGEVIFIPAGPKFPHQIINSSNAPLKYLSISTRESPEIVEYPDSGKYVGQADADGSAPFDVIAQVAPSVDFWAGEP